MENTNYIDAYLQSVEQVAKTVDKKLIEKIVKLILEVKNNSGRLFILGVGGGAGNASHAVNDFRKLVGIEAYTPIDNVSELTARTNDDGWNSVFVNWLKGSRLNSKDCIFVLSVGGGDEEKNISTNIVTALKFAKEVGAKIFGIVGRDGGYTAKVADVAIIIPTINPDMVTPLTESFQAVVWHLMVSHPILKVQEAKWESIK
ncbi:sugar isomerase [Candidatus Nomurabacteria bacterium RIFCSPLOWO2_01_FULL_42_17]|uniref:Sugar isomerase n=1 Tax=Candidatus Nomurabacteria bacterium RIFCSPLOWO2_01_FULL_42_17 TaxID=1801780 RepID=A0A1F6XN69_9BACT|nr:MAG: sugar isomerase [Candidatus Nomurabacteria bacterium RIFCSPLOWO2_01_FULL_42_17]